MSRVTLLTDALGNLAAPAEKQLSRLKELGLANGIDELALQYDDIAAAAEDMVEKNELDAPQRDAVRTLNEYLKSISGRRNARLWTAEALSSSPEWQHVRDLANHALKLFRP